MVRDLSTDPRDRMGVFKRYEDVPARYRLNRYEGEYRGKDVWQQFLDEKLLAPGRSERYCEDAHRAGRLWKEHLADRGRHHALAIPADVDTWCSSLLETRNPTTVYNDYWAKLEQFYTWLLFHTDHPHVYHPFLIAAAEGEAASRIWAEKVNRRQK